MICTKCNTIVIRFCYTRPDQQRTLCTPCVVNEYRKAHPFPGMLASTAVPGVIDAKYASG